MAKQSAWMTLVKKTKRANPGKPFKTILRLASKKYKVVKRKKKGGAGKFAVAARKAKPLRKKRKAGGMIGKMVAQYKKKGLLKGVSVMKTLVKKTRKGGALKRKPRKKRVTRKGGGWKKALGIIGGIGAAGLAASAYKLKGVGSLLSSRKYKNKF